VGSSENLRIGSYLVFRVSESGVDELDFMQAKVFIDYTDAGVLLDRQWRESFIELYGDIIGIRIPDDKITLPGASSDTKLKGLIGVVKEVS